MEMSKLEIACFNLESVLIAAKGGADRIELCADVAAGGITPDIETIVLAQEQVDVELYVMIRPRGGNFVYTDAEFASMKESIARIRELNVNGFVFGILNPDGSVNKEQNSELIKLAMPYPCTFHRAFDKTADPFDTLEVLIALGFTTVLTSGQQPDAVSGINLLSELAERSDGRITIMPGGGVRSSNISLLKQKVKTNYFHSSAIIKNDLADLQELTLLKERLLEKN